MKVTATALGTNHFVHFTYTLVLIQSYKHFWLNVLIVYLHKLHVIILEVLLDNRSLQKMHNAKVKTLGQSNN